MSIKDSVFKDSIIANSKLVLPEKYPSYNIIKLDKDIIDGKFNNKYTINVTTYGDINNRFFTALLEMISNASFINYDRNSHNISLNLSSYKNVKNILDIVFYKNYWDWKDTANSNNKSSYNVKADKNSYMSYLQYNYPLNKKNNLNMQGEKNSIGKNIILFGAPGVGKSYNIEKLIQKNGIKNYNYKNDEDFDNVLRTTLYPDYDYTDFIGQIMPTTKGGHITYTEHSGIFTKALERAYQYPNKPVFLVLEEMSRCNIASVFGDIFQLLDRDKEGRSVYGINNRLMSYKIYGHYNHKIRIPGNLFILGTLNTSDQNIYPMDTAFKRRFDWMCITINAAPAQNIKFYGILNGSKIKVTWDSLRKAINDYIVNKMQLREDKQLGQFFINFHVLNNKKTNIIADKDACKAIKGKLLFYLWNDIDSAYKAFHNDSKYCLLKHNKGMTFSKIYSDYNPVQNILSIFSKEFLKSTTFKKYILNNNNSTTKNI